VDAGIGSTADVYAQQDPASPAHPDLARGLSYLGQAFIAIAIPTPRALRVDVGKFSTPVGLEDNESMANWNYSRSLLYSFAEPSLHAGLRLIGALGESLGFSLFWVDGWNSNFVDGSGMRGFGAAASFRPRATTEIVLVYMGGPEHPPTALAAPLAFRNLLDAYVIVTAGRRWTAATAVDAGTGRALAMWWGATAYARFVPWPTVAGTLRAEILSDPSGFVTGTGQFVGGATATLEWRVAVEPVRFTPRLEYRRDQSNRAVFAATSAGAREHQDTLTLAFLAAF
jgi:hypothetical protein